MTAMRSLVVGLTGGIASGKSAATAAFAALGVPILDADEIARALVAPGEPALQAIADRWPDCVRDGALDRAKMREQVFQDAQARRELENLLHPLVFQTITRRLNTIAAPYTVVAVPLLAETGRRDFYDRVLVVDVDAGLQLQRLQQRDGNSLELATAILAAQASREARLVVADDVLDNNDALAWLQFQVHALDGHYRRLAVNAKSAR